MRMGDLAMYLGWYDDSKRPMSDKIAAARAAFAERYGCAATLVLIPDGAEPVAVAGCDVRPACGRGEPIVRPGMLFVGMV